MSRGRKALTQTQVEETKEASLARRSPGFLVAELWVPFLVLTSFEAFLSGRPIFNQIHPVSTWLRDYRWGAPAEVWPAEVCFLRLAEKVHITRTKGRKSQAPKWNKIDTCKERHPIGVICSSRSLFWWALLLSSCPSFRAPFCQGESIPSWVLCVFTVFTVLILFGARWVQLSL